MNTYSFALSLYLFALSLYQLDGKKSIGDGITPATPANLSASASSAGLATHCQ